MRVLNPLPIEIAPGVLWNGECQEVAFRGQTLHSGNSVYLVAGETHSALVEAANSFQIEVVMDQIETMLRERSLPDVKYIFVTHSEAPHAGGVGHLLDRFPDAVACGGISDLPAIFPQFADRFLPSEIGDRLDLGGTELVVVDGAFRDMPYTRWAFDTRSRVLFSGDGFSFTHEHDAEHCGCFAEDIPGLDIAAMMELYIVAAFNWVEYVDIQPHLDRLDRLVFDELRAAVIAPTHGLPIRDPRTTVPILREGMRRASHSVTTGLVH